MNVIIFGSNHHNTLGLIMSAGEAGHTVYLLLLKSGFNFVNKSSYLKSWQIIESMNDVLPAVVGISRECDSKPVLLVAGDHEAAFVNHHFEELSKYCHAEGGRKNDDIVIYHDKFRSNNLAKDFGFRIPKTWMIEDRARIPQDLSFPLLVKASASIKGGKGVLKKVNSLKDLETELHSISDAFFPLQVQEYIQKDYEIIILGCSLNHGEEVVCPVAERKLRYYPQEFRTTAYTESLLIRDNQELLSITNQIEAMIKSIGYTGLFSVELIYANHSYYFLETNFRNDGTAYLATVCGYNLPDLLCQSFSGKKIIPHDNYKPCHYVNVLADGMNVVHGRVPLFTWIRQLKDAKCYSHYSSKDKSPLVWAILAMVVNKFSNR